MSSLSAQAKARKQFKPNVNLTTTSAYIAPIEEPANPLLETKKEPVAPKEPKFSRPPRGFDRVTSIFELGVAKDAPSKSSNRSDEIGGPRSGGGGRGSVLGAQENLIEIENVDSSELSVTALSDSRGPLDPVTSFHGEESSVGNLHKNCATLLFDNINNAPFIFQLPISALNESFGNKEKESSVKIGKIQKLKSGKVRLLLPVSGSGEQEVPNDNSSTELSQKGKQSLTLSFRSASNSESTSLCQIACLQCPSATPKVETDVSAAAVRPQKLTTDSMNMLMLGKVAGRISCSVNFQ